MAISKKDQQELKEIFEEYGEKHGGVKQDYFAPLYLKRRFKCKIDEIMHQVAFGGSDYGVDAYYLDRETRNLYLFQFKWSEDYALFKQSLERLTNFGFSRIFCRDGLSKPNDNELLRFLEGDLAEYKDLINRIYVQFVFKGEARSAEKSEVLEFLREGLYNKQFLIDQYFENRRVELRIEFVSDIKAPPPPPPPVDVHSVSFTDKVSIFASDEGKTLHVGFISLGDLNKIYGTLGQRFLSRNIRAGLSPNNPPNKKIRLAIEEILRSKKASPQVFTFNHNGVTLAAANVEFADGAAMLSSPRLLNGAQTVTTIAKFLEDNKGNANFEIYRDGLKAVRVLAKIVEDAPDSDFVTNVTICNNQQNPVEPWNLRANDRIQSELQEKLRTEVGIYYARQEGTSPGIEELEQLGIEEPRPIEIRPLAQTFLAVQGEIDKMSHLPDVFEVQTSYDAAFKRAYLDSDTRKIVVAYKIGAMLSRVMRKMEESSPDWLAYAVRSARNLVWAMLIQGVLNDPKLPELLEDFGRDLARQPDFAEKLRGIATNRILPVITKVVNGNEVYKQRVKEEKYAFLRQKECFKRCMNVVEEKYGWGKKSF